MDRTDPPYRLISDHFRDRIASGELAPGERLPTMAAIATEMGVSPRTAQKALQQLRGEGLVQITQQGVTVRDAPRAISVPPERASRPDQPGDHLVVTSAEMSPMFPNVGAALGINSDALNRTVVRREVVAHRDGSPYRLAVGWLAPSWTHDVPELLDPTPISNVLKLIAERTGRRAGHGRDYFEARTADGREADALMVAAGSSVLAGTSVWSDEEGPIMYYEWVVQAHRAVTFDYSLGDY